MIGFEHNCMRVRNPRTTWQIFDYALLLSRVRMENSHNASDSVHFLSTQRCGPLVELVFILSAFADVHEHPRTETACMCTIRSKTPGHLSFFKYPTKRNCQILTSSYYFCSTIVHQFFDKNVSILDGSLVRPCLLNE